MPVFDRHVPAVEFDHLGTHLAMDGIERSLTDGGRLNQRQNEPQSASSGWLPGCVNSYAGLITVSRRFSVGQTWKGLLRKFRNLHVGATVTEGVIPKPRALTSGARDLTFTCNLGLQEILRSA